MVSKSLLASKFEIVRSAAATQTPALVGIDIRTGQVVTLSPVSRPVATRLAAARGVSHRHLAQVLEIVELTEPGDLALLGLDEPMPVVVVEAVRGPTLRSTLVDRPCGLDRSVAYTVRLAEGLRALHGRQVPHGSISSYSVTALPLGRAIPPVLAFGVAPAMAAYASPERLTGGGASLPDDLWALGVLLCEMLSGTVPFRGSTLDAIIADQRPSRLPSLRDLDHHGSELEPVIQRFFEPDPKRRYPTVDDVIDALERWERRAPPPMAISLPPVLHRTRPRSDKAQLAPHDVLQLDLDTLPGSLEPLFALADERRQAIAGPTAARKARSAKHAVEATVPMRVRASFAPEAFQRRLRSDAGVSRRWGLGALGLLIVGGGVAYGLRDPDGPEPAASARAVDSTPALLAPQVQKRKLTAKEERTTCVRSYFPDDAFTTKPDLDFVCADGDFLGMTRKLNDLVMAGSSAAPASSAGHERGASGLPAAAPSGSAAVEKPASPLLVRGAQVLAQKSWQLGWYELLAASIVRRNCCRDASPITLPETTGWCQQLQTVVRKIAEDSTKSGDLSPAVRTFDDTLTCLLAQGRHTSYPYRAIPSPTEQASFRRFLSHAAESDALRSSRR